MKRIASRRTLARKALLACACALTTCCLAQAAFAHGPVRDVKNDAVTPPVGYSVGLEQCVTSTVQSERSATFTAQMVATDATQRMAIKIELQQRMRGENEYHTLLAPGLGEWRSSESGVKIYKYVKQVTNLAAPAAYRALVRFHWLDGHGHVLKRTELRTVRCLQMILPSQVTTTPVPAT